MRRAYRRRLEAARWGLFGVAFALLTIVHFTFSPWWLPLLVVAVGCAVLGGWGERVLFPHAWRIFDVPQPSPALEEEARGLARTMGVRPCSLRVVDEASARVRWLGGTLITTTALRDLPPGERRFALAWALAGAPDRASRFRRAAAWPTFYAGFAAWVFGVPFLPTACALALGLWGVAALVRAWAVEKADTRLALAVTGDPEGARAFLTRERDAGSPRAARELAALEVTRTPLPSGGEGAGGEGSGNIETSLNSAEP